MKYNVKSKECTISLLKSLNDKNWLKLTILFIISLFANVEVLPILYEIQSTNQS